METPDPYQNSTKNFTIGGILGGTIDTYSVGNVKNLQEVEIDVKVVWLLWQLSFFPSILSNFIVILGPLIDDHFFYPSNVSMCHNLTVALVS